MMLLLVGLAVGALVLILATSSCLWFRYCFQNHALSGDKMVVYGASNCELYSNNNYQYQNGRRPTIVTLNSSDLLGEYGPVHTEDPFNHVNGSRSKSIFVLQEKEPHGSKYSVCNDPDCPINQKYLLSKCDRSSPSVSDAFLKTYYKDGRSSNVSPSAPIWKTNRSKSAVPGMIEGMMSTNKCKEKVKVKNSKDKLIESKNVVSKEIQSQSSVLDLDEKRLRTFTL